MSETPLLHPPSDGKSYVALEIIWYAIEFKVTSKVANAIDAMKEYGPSKAKVNRLIKENTEETDAWEAKYTMKMIAQLLHYLEVGSTDWVQKVTQIANAQHGPSVATICKHFGGKPAYDYEGNWMFQAIESTSTSPKAVPLKCSTVCVADPDKANIVSPTYQSDREMASSQLNCQPQQYIDVQINIHSEVDKENTAPNIRRRTDDEDEEEDHDDALPQTFITERTGLDGIFTIMVKDATDRKTAKQFLPLKKPRKADISDNKDSRNRWIKRNSNQLKLLLERIMPDGIESGLKDAVVSKFASEHGLFVAEKKKLKLSIENIVAMRDIVGGGTNMMCRIKSSFDKYLPDARGLVFPSCIKARLGEFDKTDNEEHISCLHQCIISSTDNTTKTALRNHTALKFPCHVIERICELAILEDVLEESETFMNSNFSNMLLFSWNCDKGGKVLPLTIKLLNRIFGNSMKYTFPIALTEGPLRECYANLNETTFNEKYPTKIFLQRLTDDHLFMLTVTVGSSQCQCFAFLPIPSHEVCTIRSIGVEILEEKTVESAVLFDEEDETELSPPKVEIPLEEDKIGVRLIVSDDDASTIVGMELVVRGLVKYTHEFRKVMKIGDDSPKARLQQIQGHAPNDMKMGQFVNGVCSNSCLSPCLCCTCPREEWDLKRVPKRVYVRMVERGIDVGRYSIQDCPKREGDMSTAACHGRWAESTFHGDVILTEGHERHLKIKCASTNSPPLVCLHYLKNLISDPMHVGGGLANRMFEEMMKRIRELEKDEEFMANARQILTEIEEMIAKLKLTSEDDTQLLAPHHDESKKLRRRLLKILREMEDLALSDDDDDESHDEKMAELKLAYDEMYKKIESHAEDSNYAHLCQLRTGLIDMLDCLQKAMRPSSKRPGGPLEFCFVRAREVFGGNYMPDHGGNEQTTNIAMNSLEHFDQIADICRGAYPESHPLFEEIDKMFTRFQELAKPTLELTKLLKSQKKTSALKFLDTLIDFHVKWEEVFPGVPVFNKYHSLLSHYIQHVDLYEFIGRSSGEGHEAFHAMLARLRKTCCNMSSYDQSNKTFWSRVCAILKPGVSESFALFTEMSTGTKRGKYDISERRSKLQDSTKCSVSVFDSSTVTVDGEEFVLMATGNARIPMRYKDYFLYFKFGIAEDKWMQPFRNSNKLSDTKLEAAKYA